jgi:hypothetical protein
MQSHCVSDLHTCPSVGSVYELKAEVALFLRRS